MKFACCSLVELSLSIVQLDYRNASNRPDKLAH